MVSNVIRHVISLDMFSGVDLGLIVPWPTGIIYSNQANGVGCDHPELEGAYIPFGSFPERETEPNHKALAEHFASLPGNREYFSLETADVTANFIDEFLVSTELPFAASVDRSRLNDSYEAWVWLTFGPPKTEHLGLYTSFEKLDSAVLVWPNSD